MDLIFLHNPEEFPEDRPLEDSAYFWWFRFMQLAQKKGLYGPTHPLWDEFGDTLTTGAPLDEDETDFWHWWNRNQLSFQSGQLGVWVIETDEEIATARKEGAVLIRLDRECTRDYLRFNFEETLKELNIGMNPGRWKHQHEVMNAKRPFAKRPEVRSLEKSFKVLEKRLQRPQPTLYDVGKELKINPDAVYKDSDIRSQKSAQTNRMNATVSRYERQGKKILAGVLEGKFPVM